MAKKIVYSKGFDGVSDFVYVDLLPDVKRSRQFNMNVIIALTFAVVLAFVLVYMPFRAATENFEEVNGLNNDLQHELLLTNEELIGYEINLDTIVFENDIDILVNYKVDFIVLLNQLKGWVNTHNVSSTTFISDIQYNGNSNTFVITIESTDEDVFTSIETEFQTQLIEWVGDINVLPIEDKVVDGVEFYFTTFTIGVDIDAE